MRLFVLLSRFPYPLEKGDKLRAYHQLRILSQHHEVFLCALHEDPLDPEWIGKIRPLVHHLETIQLSRSGQFSSLAASLLGNEPFQVAYFYQSAAQERINKIIEDRRPDAIYCQLLRTAKYVAHIDSVPKIIDFQDAFSKGIERRLQTDPWYLQPVLRSELKRLNRYEKQIFRQFDRCTIISEQDRAQLPFEQRNEVVIVPNGVDTEHFYPSEQTEKNVDVLFAGNMGYPPNVEGAVFLAREVMPLVRKELPSTTLMLAGARPDQKVLDLNGPLTQVTGWVDDMRHCYAQAKVFVAPMMIGTGLQNKLLEAMAMKLPCVTSTLANNALGAIPEKQVLIAESPQEYADHIVKLLSDDTMARAYAEAGNRLIREKFSWEGATRPLLELLA